MYIYYKLGCVVTIGRKFCETQLPISNAWKACMTFHMGLMHVREQKFLKITKNRYVLIEHKRKFSI